MRSSFTSAAAGLAIAASTVSAQDITSSSCVDGLFMIVARGTNEIANPGTGAFGAIAERIADRIDDSKVVAIDYPATFTDPIYNESVDEGSAQMREAVRNYTTNCPDNKLAVFGYSQGAHVTSNTFCGGNGGDFDDEPALPASDVEGHVISVVLFGDPTHRKSAPYDLGTSTKNGLFSRPNITACEKYDFIQSYCDSGDVYCDTGSVPQVHGSYVWKYGQDVVKFVIEEWNAATDSDVSTDNISAFPTPSRGVPPVSTTSATGTVTPPSSATTTPGADTTVTTPEATTTETKTEAETGTTSSGEEPSASETNVDEVGGEGAAAGLASVGSVVVAVPMMLVFFWNLL